MYSSTRDSSSWELGVRALPEPSWREAKSPEPNPRERGPAADGSPARSPPVHVMLPSCRARPFCRDHLPVVRAGGPNLATPAAGKLFWSHRGTMLARRRVAAARDVHGVGLVLVRESGPIW